MVLDRQIAEDKSFSSYTKITVDVLDTYKVQLNTNTPTGGGPWKHLLMLPHVLCREFR